ncbi:MAG: GntR family transcriptional regulator [Cryobacterium sp.]|nr:GntR family transcriptional regulator [Cryobacterium sp.]
MIATLRAAIVDGEYQAGERLGERQLCLRFGVSRTVVREALRFLEAERLVTVIPNVGPVVRGISKTEAAAIFEVRAGLEALAAELFATKATASERARLTGAVESVRAAFEEDSHVGWILSKDEFYAALTEGAHNEILGETLLRLQSQVSVLRKLSLGSEGRRPQTFKEVSDIVRFAVAGDAENAARAARLHVEAAAVVAMRELDAQTGAGAR